MNKKNSISYWLSQESNFLKDSNWLRKILVCNDGFSMSVQASEAHYCTPRKSMVDFYTHVEVGYPNAKEDLFMEYAEEKEKPTETVYGWVPIEIIDQIIKKHGGIK